MAKPLTDLGQYEQQAVRTVEREGYAVVEKAPEITGCWVAWHYDQSYRQKDTHVFGTELEALRWAMRQQANHEVTFVPWGSSPEDVIKAAKKGS